MKFKSVVGGVVAATLLSSAAFADTASPLPAGRAAGTHDATLMGVDAGVVATIAVGVVVVVAIAGGFSGSKISTVSTAGPFVNP